MEVIEEQEPGGAIRAAEAARMRAPNPNQGRWPLAPLPPAWSNKERAPFSLPPAPRTSWRSLERLGPGCEWNGGRALGET